MQEYLDLRHAELVPSDDLLKAECDVVYKSSSTTTKVRAVIDALARSATGASLNDCLFVGPTVHSPLIDVLLCFRLY